MHELDKILMFNVLKMYNSKKKKKKKRESKYRYTSPDVGNSFQEMQLKSKKT